MSSSFRILIVSLLSLCLCTPINSPVWPQDEGGDGQGEGSGGTVNEGIDIGPTRDDYNSETNTQSVEFDAVGREHGRGSWREGEAGGDQSGGERDSNRNSAEGGVGHSERRGRSEYREYGKLGNEYGPRESNSRESSSDDRAHIDRSSNRSEDSSREGREVGQRLRNETIQNRELLFDAYDRSITRPKWTKADIDLQGLRPPSNPERVRARPRPSQIPGAPDLPRFLDLENLAMEKPNSRHPLNIRGRLPDRFFGDARFFKEPLEEPGLTPVLIGPFEGVVNEDSPADWNDPAEAEKIIEHLKNAQRAARNELPQNRPHNLETYLEASEFFREFAAELLEQGLVPESFGMAGVATHLFMQAAPGFLQMAVPFTPLGDLQDLVEAASGRELFTGRQLTTPERVVSLAAVIFGNARLYRAALNSNKKIIREASELAANLERIWERFPSDTPDVVRSLKSTGKLPDRFISKDQARALGWNHGKNLSRFAPGKAIGGDRFYNKEGMLPDIPGRTWHEVDLGYISGKRTSERLLYSNDGKIFLTDDHYEKDWVDITEELEIFE